VIVNKSKLLKQLSDQYPGFLKKDLLKTFNIFFNEIMNSLKRGENVELRGQLGTFSTKIQKASIRRNPKTSEKVYVNQKRVIRFRMSKALYSKLNNEKKI
jgi:integration host factor subunit beta|tara:strand:- start:709 stop:1008 length:300 start_codon:yes stop_codon:yes gene_type:complete